MNKIGKEKEGNMFVTIMIAKLDVWEKVEQRPGHPEQPVEKRDVLI